MTERCADCGHDLDPTDQHCPNCRQPVTQPAHTRHIHAARQAINRARNRKDTPTRKRTATTDH